jgi:hypothetical protein
MSGVVAGLIASVKAGSAPAPTNILTNGAFTSGTLNWSGGNLSADAVIYRSAPFSGNTFDSDDYDADATYDQATGLTAGQSYSFSAWIRNPNNAQTFGIYLKLGTTTHITTSPTLPISTGWQQIKFENLLANGSAIQIAISANAYPTIFNIDDVSLVLGSTALS